MILLVRPRLEERGEYFKRAYGGKEMKHKEIFNKAYERLTELEASGILSSSNRRSTVAT